MNLKALFFPRARPRPISTPTQTASVSYGISVMNADGTLARRLPRKRNLILDSGLDQLAVRNWGNVFEYMVLGTGTTPTKKDSGAITFTRAGNTVTASAGFFAAGDVPSLLKFDTGEEMRVTAYTSATVVTVDTAGALGASQATLYYVAQTGLTTELLRTGSYRSEGGDNGKTWDAGAAKWTFKRTFLTAAFGAPATLNEIGWSYTAAAGANLFGRDIITGGLPITAGQFVVCVMELSVSLAPAVPTAWAQVVAAWAPSGNAVIEGAELSGPQADGSTEGGRSLDPNAVSLAFLTSDSTALLANTNNVSRSIGGVGAANIVGPTSSAAAAYVAGNFYRDYVYTWGPAAANRADIRAMGLGNESFNNLVTQFRILLTAAVAKNNTQQLSLTFRKSWGRTLVN